MGIKGEGAQQCVRWTILGLSVLAWVLSIVVVAHCSFIHLDNSDRGIGLFSFEDFNGNCESYDDPDFDTAFKSARAFGVLTPITSGFAMVLVVCLLLFMGVIQKPLWITVRVLFFMAVLFQLLAFLAFLDDICEVADCAVGAATGIGAANVLFLLTLAILSCLVPPPQKPALQNCCNDCCSDCCTDEEAVVTKQVREAPMSSTVEAAQRTSVGESTKITIVKGKNGETTTRKEVTHADGSKTITETIEVSK